MGIFDLEDGGEKKSTRRFARLRTIGVIALAVGMLLGFGGFMWQTQFGGPDGDVNDSRRVYTGGERVFPGAEGFGTRRKRLGERKVVRVTTLKSSGRGSLRQALASSGPRIIEFDVAGTIELEKDLEIIQPDVEIAGETAPVPGITLVGAGLRVKTHDVLIRHLRIRPGDRPAGPRPENRDGISIEGNSAGSAAVYNIVIDHCSISWAIDEGIALWYTGVRDVTISQCIIAENLSRSLHPKGEHSKGLLVGDHVKRVAMIGNLFAHNMARNPLMKGDTSVLVVNNVIYNPGRNAIHFADDGFLSGGKKGPALATVMGNVIRGGPDTPEFFSPLHFHHVAKGTQVFWKDNLFDGKPLNPWRKRSEWSRYRAVQASVECRPLTVKPASAVFEWVLENAGARPSNRDAADVRIVGSVREKSGKIIDSTREVEHSESP